MSTEVFTIPSIFSEPSSIVGGAVQSSEEVFVEILDDCHINIFCLDEKNYSSDDFLLYLYTYLDDFMTSADGLIYGGYPRIVLPGYVSFETYGAVGEMVFELSEQEYSSLETQKKVYDLLWEC